MIWGGDLSRGFGNLFWGMQFRTCENFGESTDLSLVLSPKFSQIQKPHRHYFDCRFVQSTNLIKKSNQKSLLKFLLLFAFAKSRISLTFIDSNLPNDAFLQNLKRFCFVLLLPKVESLLSLNLNAHNDK